jgi:hypothetical protein
MVEQRIYRVGLIEDISRRQLQAACRNIKDRRGCISALVIAKVRKIIIVITSKLVVETIKTITPSGLPSQKQLWHKSLDKARQGRRLTDDGWMTVSRFAYHIGGSLGYGNNHRHRQPFEFDKKTSLSANRNTPSQWAWAKF